MNSIEMIGISKKFGDFTANDNIDFALKKGEIHALLGENGAGKSTLMNILYGILQPNAGIIKVNGEEVKITSPTVAIEMGIGMVHQHFMLVDDFTVTENIMLGYEINKYGLLQYQEANEKMQALANQYGLKIDVTEKVENLSVGEQQRVEILKGLYREVDVLILDEPTAVLTPQEIDDFLAIIKKLSEDGKSILIITHKLKEIAHCAQRLTIIRRGKKIGEVNAQDVTEEEMAELMVGRPVSLKVEKADNAVGEVVFALDKLRVKNVKNHIAVDDLSLELRRGEILGLAGVDGNGQKELLEAISGLCRFESGTLSVDGYTQKSVTPKWLTDHGVASIPEDRQKHGLVMEFSVAENMVLQTHEKWPFATKRGLIQPEPIREFADELIEKFDVRPRKSDAQVSGLSGGNQQKVILARELSNDPVVLIAAQPTRGLDVGAIEFVHKQLVKRRNENKAVLLISSELDELLSLSDRLAVLYQGKIQGYVEPKEENIREIGYLMAGGKKA